MERSEAEATLPPGQGGLEPSPILPYLFTGPVCFTGNCMGSTGRHAVVAGPAAQRAGLDAPVARLFALRARFQARSARLLALRARSQARRAKPFALRAKRGTSNARLRTLRMKRCTPRCKAFCLAHEAPGFARKAFRLARKVRSFAARARSLVRKALSLAARVSKRARNAWNAALAAAPGSPATRGGVRCRTRSPFLSRSRLPGPSRRDSPGAGAPGCVPARAVDVVGMELPGAAGGLSRAKELASYSGATGQPVAEEPGASPRRKARIWPFAGSGAGAALNRPAGLQAGRSKAKTAGCDAWCPEVKRTHRSPRKRRHVPADTQGDRHRILPAPAPCHPGVL